MPMGTRYAAGAETSAASEVSIIISVMPPTAISVAFCEWLIQGRNNSK